MTEKQVLETIEGIRPNIKRLAHVFIPKMRQPPIHKLEDLEQEGELVVLRQIAMNRHKEGRGASLQTYLIQSVRTRFIDLMHESYRKEPVDFNGYFTEGSTDSKTNEANLLLEIIESFPWPEKRYMAAILFPPQRIRNQIARDKKVTRKLIREELNMTREEEHQLRENIKEKLTRR